MEANTSTSEQPQDPVSQEAQERISLMGQLEGNTATNGCTVVGSGNQKAILFPVPVDDGEGQPVYYIVTQAGYGKIPVPKEDPQRASFLDSDVKNAMQVDRSKYVGERAGFYAQAESPVIILHETGDPFTVQRLNDADIQGLGNAYQRSQERLKDIISDRAIGTAANNVLKQAMGK